MMKVYIYFVCTSSFCSSDIIIKSEPTWNSNILVDLTRQIFLTT